MSRKVSRGSFWAGPRLRITRAPLALARRAAAWTSATGTSSCSTSVVPGPSSASGMLTARASRLAPPATAIRLRPSPSTQTAAQPVGPSLSSTPLASTPASRRLSRIIVPNTSRPTRPTMATFAPSRTAATAWLAPLPPGTERYPVPSTVSPGRGRAGRANTRSMLIEPKTRITGGILAGSLPAPSCFRPGRAGNRHWLGLLFALGRVNGTRNRA